MKTAVFSTGMHRTELKSSPRLHSVSSLQGKKHGFVFSGLQKKVETIRSAFNTIISSAITYKPVDNRLRAGYSGRNSYR